MRKFVVLMVLAILSAALLSCSGRSSIPAGQLPNISGPWEFQATSNSNTATFTSVDVALQEGQTIVNGMQQPNGQVSASGSNQIAIVSVDPGNETVDFAGACVPTGSSGNSLTGSVQSLGGAFNFSYTENGNVFNVTANISADGKSVLGTYTSASSCVDSGTIVGTALSKISGVYGGTLILPDNTYTITATLSESSNTLTANVIASNPSSINLTLTGPVTGNAFVLQGTYQGQQVTYEGYFGLQVSNGPAIYFVNATNAAQPTYAGTLVPTH